MKKVPTKRQYDRLSTYPGPVAVQAEPTEQRDDASTTTTPAIPRSYSHREAWPSTKQPVRWSGCLVASKAAAVSSASAVGS
jgi:hypothetical protein